MDQKRKKYLQKQAGEVRKEIIKMIACAGQGHVGGCLSIADVVTALYFELMKVDPGNPAMEGRDRLVLSKGHAGPALYAALALRGYFPMEKLKTLNQPHTDLPSHCDMLKTPGIDMTAGSLGQGISCAVGIAKAVKIKKGSETVYVIIGDGESQEGSVWEASMAAAQYKLDNLIVFLDYNRLQIDGTVDEVMSLIDPAAKWSAFGFDTAETDGHDPGAIVEAARAVQEKKNGRPKLIVLHTVKGKGVSFVEAEGAGSHSMPITAGQAAAAVAEIEGRLEAWN